MTYRIVYRLAFLIILFATLAFSIKAQSLYDINTIQKIEIQFSQTNWDYQMDTAKAGSEGYIMADWVKINGVQFDSAGVKYKGNSSYNAGNAKNPMHIDLEEFKNNQAYQGYTDIKLGNGFSDPSFVREVLAYKILQNYMHCPQANFAQVYINGIYYGLFSNPEAINKDFVGTHFYSNDNPFFKCNPQNTSATNGPNLTYFSTDSAQYYTRYEIKSDYGWNQLLNLCDTLANNTAGMDQILDIDRAIWMIAFNNVLVNLDSYTGAFTQNYYLYMDNNGRFNPVVWDLNMSFGGFNMTGSGPPSSVTQMQQLSPTLHATNTSRPLIKDLLADARYKKMYIAHMRTIANENFATGTYVTEAQNLMSMIDTAVQSDANKFFTYTQFQNSLSTSYTSGPMTIPGIQLLMDARNTYLQSTTEFTATPPTITAVTHTPTNPAFNATADITATVTNTNSNAVYLGYRSGLSDIFTRILMYDDGAHNDGAAGDNVYGVTININSGQVQYYIYAENNNAGMFSPERAEHEFYEINASITMVNAGDIVINELMADNETGVLDANGDTEDWIELYNNTSSPVSLGVVYLSDDFATPLKWEFPVNTVIPAGGFITLWADEDTTQSDIHCNFKLSSSGEQLILSYSNGTVIDSVIFGAQDPDVSYGRYPNGTGSFVSMPATFGTYNSLASVEELDKEVSFSIYPNPSNGSFSIASNNEIIHEIEIYNSLMQLVYSEKFANERLVKVNQQSLLNGCYIVRVNKDSTRKIIVNN